MVSRVPGRFYRRLFGPACAFVCALPLAAAGRPAAIVTYHNDPQRTGWNAQETTLTPSRVAAGFGLLSQVALDEQADAQPLFLSGQKIAGMPGQHDVVYVATENNSIYAIDAESGAVLLQANYGTPVPLSALPGGCNNNSNYIGINSTPVIDPATNTLYAITNTYETGKSVFRLHAIDATTLKDRRAPVEVKAKAPFANGHVHDFVSANQRQRSALLEANGNIYAGFASWCDINANVSRGWVLGWNAATLAPLGNAELTDRRPHSPGKFYLSSIWMSGYGIAADSAGSLYFATGNTNPDGRDYDSAANPSESILRMASDLSAVQDFFTPNGGPYGWSALDVNDGDFASGGVLVLPDQPGPVPHLAIAVGKSGPLYLLNRDALGGLTAPSGTLGQYANNGCWCGQSYFVGSDQVPRIVESTGSNLDIWTLQTSGTPSLTHESGNTLASGQDPGFFTFVSSNGTAPGSAIVWAIGRPTNAKNPELRLYAFDPANGSAVLFSGVAGTWPFAGSANANIVPVPAGGGVFVASYKNLSIFGLTTGARAARRFVAPDTPRIADAIATPHAITGTVTVVAGNRLTLVRRDGTRIAVDTAAARAANLYAPAAAGRASRVYGDWRQGVFAASEVLHAMPSAALWTADR